MKHVKDWIDLHMNLNFMALLIEILATPLLCFLSGDAVYWGKPVTAVMLFCMAAWLGVDSIFRLVGMLFPVDDASTEGESK